MKKFLIVLGVMLFVYLVLVVISAVIDLNGTTEKKLKNVRIERIVYHPGKNSKAKDIYMEQFKYYQISDERDKDTVEFTIRVNHNGVNTYHKFETTNMLVGTAYEENSIVQMEVEIKNGKVVRVNSNSLL